MPLRGTTAMKALKPKLPIHQICGSLNTFAGTELFKTLKSRSCILDFWWYLLQELKLEVVEPVENAELICMAPL